MSHWDTVDVMISLCDGPNPWRADGSYPYVHLTKIFLRRNSKCFSNIMVNLPKSSCKLPNLGQANHCRKPPFDRTQVPLNHPLINHGYGHEATPLGPDFIRGWVILHP